MTQTNFNANKRSAKKAKQLRRLGLLPANVYIPKKDSIALEINPVAFTKLYQEVGETGLVYLSIEGESKAIPALIDQVTKDYLGSNFEHVVFRGVDLKEKITAKIPVEVVGEFDVLDAVLITVQDEVEIEALPTDFPEKFVFDASNLKEIGDSFSLADLVYDKEKIQLVLAEDEDPSERVLVSVQAQAEEEVEEVSEELVEPEVIGEAERSEKAETEKAEADQGSGSEKSED